MQVPPGAVAQRGCEELGIQAAVDHDRILVRADVAGRVEDARAEVARLLRKGCVQAEDINALCSQREREDHTGETDALETVGDHQDGGAGLRLKLGDDTAVGVGDVAASRSR